MVLANKDIFGESFRPRPKIRVQFIFTSKLSLID